MELNDADRHLVEYLAPLRYEYCRRIGSVATRYGRRSREDALRFETDNFGAEVWYCKLFNCYPDTDPTHFLPYDAIVEGFKVDVKQTDYENGRLLVKCLTRLEMSKLPDMYALVIGKFPKYRLAGHYLATLTIQPDRIDHTLAFPAYAVGQGELIQSLSL